MRPQIPAPGSSSAASSDTAAGSSAPSRLPVAKPIGLQSPAPFHTVGPQQPQIDPAKVAPPKRLVAAQKPAAAVLKPAVVPPPAAAVPKQAAVPPPKAPQQLGPVAAVRPLVIFDADAERRREAQKASARHKTDWRRRKAAGRRLAAQGLEAGSEDTAPMDVEIGIATGLQSPPTSSPEASPEGDQLLEPSPALEPSTASVPTESAETPLASPEIASPASGSVTTPEEDVRMTRVDIEEDESASPSARSTSRSSTHPAKPTLPVSHAASAERDRLERDRLDRDTVGWDVMEEPAGLSMPNVTPQMRSRAAQQEAVRESSGRLRFRVPTAQEEALWTNPNPGISYGTVVPDLPRSRSPPPERKDMGPIVQGRVKEYMSAPASTKAKLRQLPPKPKVPKEAATESDYSASSSTALDRPRRMNVPPVPVFEPSEQFKPSDVYSSKPASGGSAAVASTVTSAGTLATPESPRLRHQIGKVLGPGWYRPGSAPASSGSQPATRGRGGRISSPPPLPPPPRAERRPAVLTPRRQEHFSTL